MGDVVLLKQRAKSQDLMPSPIRLLLPHQVMILCPEKLERDTEERAKEVRRRIKRYSRLLSVLDGEDEAAEFLTETAFMLRND